MDFTITVVRRFIKERSMCCLIVKYDARLFLEFSSSFSVTNFQNVLGLQRVITLRHSIFFQCNWVHEQTTLSPTICSQKIYDLFLSFLHNFGFFKRRHFADYTTSIGLLIWRA